MTSNDDNSANGKSFHHNMGSTSTVKVGSRSLPLYPWITVCLGLLNFALTLTAVVIGIYCSKVNEVPAPHLTTLHVLFIEVKQLQIMQAEAIRAQEEAQQALKKELRNHQQLKLQLERDKTFSDVIQGQLEALHLERATLQSDSSDMRESCGRCLPGWFLFNTSCYFHSKYEPRRNWLDSKADCISRGANLTVIDSWEEQLNLFEYLPKPDPGIRLSRVMPGGVWIGLTDIQTEGNWVWLNNVAVQDGGYWIEGEPNNYGRMGEDCAAFMNFRNPRETWFDANCQENKEWLCEMEPN